MNEKTQYGRRESSPKDTTLDGIKIFEFDDVNGILTAALCDDTERIPTLQKELALRGIVEFTDKEIKAMPNTLRRIMTIQKKRCVLRTRESGKDTTTYEIRLRRDGWNVTACGKSIEIAKANFIKKLQTAKQTPKVEKTGGGFSCPVTFSAFALYHFEHFKKDRVTQKHYENSLRLFHRYLSPVLKEKPIKDITPVDVKEILDKETLQGKGKTADDLHSMLNGIFKTAILHGLITLNPISLILHVQHERQNGTSLSKAEEKELLNALKGSRFYVPAALALYSGLRPNELATAKIEGNFIKAVNSKRHNNGKNKIEYKYIPIISNLQPFLPSDGVFAIPNLDTFRDAVRKALPSHRLYDLRVTFYTRCDEYGVAPPARDEYVGHSGSTLTNTYRDLSLEYLLEEGKKLNKWT